MYQYLLSRPKSVASLYTEFEYLIFGRGYN